MIGLGLTYYELELNFFSLSLNSTQTRVRVKFNRAKPEQGNLMHLDSAYTH
jgi:hypothetical protein